LRPDLSTGLPLSRIKRQQAANRAIDHTVLSMCANSHQLNHTSLSAKMRPLLFGNRYPAALGETRDNRAACPIGIEPHVPNGAATA
jgi:hypothetical protein